MKRELSKLETDYPSLFFPTGLAPAIGAGWIPLVENLCKELVKLPIDFKFLQIKEKFGGMRIYYSSKPDLPKARELVFLAEISADNICENCGKIGRLRDDKFWMRTLCEDCNKKNN